MKRIFIIYLTAIITLYMGNSASASYFDAIDTRDVWIPVEISSTEFGPDEWFQMGSDVNPFPSDYNPSEITSFTITLSGDYAQDDDIDIFLDFALSGKSSGRRRGHPRRPPTPPYVRFRIRRFMK